MWRRRHVRLTPTTAAIIIGTAALAVVARDVFHAAHRVIGWAAAAVVVAALLELPIGILAKRIGRVTAVLLTFAAMAAVVIALVYGVFDNLRTEAERFQEAAPAAAARLQARTDKVGDIARDLKLKARTDQLAKDIEKRLGGGGGEALLASVGSLPTYLVGAILTIFLMTFGPRLVRDGLAQIRDDTRRTTVSSVLSRALIHARGGIFVMMAQAILVGVLVGSTCWALHLPAPVTVGVLGALLGLIPYLGIALASFPVVLLAAGFRSVTSAVVVLVIALALQTVEGVWLRPRVDRPTMRIGPAVPWLVGLLGFAVYGIGGALYGAAYAVFGLAVLDAIAVQRRALDIAIATSS
jgi:predicted PurR-regulated permease PerM